MYKNTKLIITLALLALLSACATEQPKNESDVDEPEKNNNEEQAAKEEFPLSELPILKNEETVYDGRPFKQMPVKVMQVEHFADKTEFSVGTEGEYEALDLRIAFTSSDKALDLAEGDFLRIDGVINSELSFDTSRFNIGRKAELVNFEKVEFLDVHDLKLVSKTEHKNLYNEHLNVTITQIDKGEKFSRIYYTNEPQPKVGVGSYEVIVTQGGKEIKEIDDSIKITANTFLSMRDLKSHVAVFPSFDTEQPFDVSITYKAFMTQEEVKPLVFNLNQ